MLCNDDITLLVDSKDEVESKKIGTWRYRERIRMKTRREKHEYMHSATDSDRIKVTGRKCVYLDYLFI